MLLTALPIELSQTWLDGTQQLGAVSQSIGYTISHALDWRQWLQLIVLGGLGLWFYLQVVRRSRSIKLFKGIFAIFFLVSALFAVAITLRLTLLITLLGFSVQVLVFTSIVVFQPELRRLLSQLGQTMASGPNWLDVRVLHDDVSDNIDILARAAVFLGKTKTGALIVFENSDGAGEHFLETGTQMDAKVSMELLLTLFHPKTPLHDGAVVVDRRHRLRSAGVLLPLTEDPKLSWQYGTRHRAAIGITEVSDSACLVISEETGRLSWVSRGQITRLTDKNALLEELEKFYNVTSKSAKEGEKADKTATATKATWPERLPFGETLSGWLSQVTQPEKP